MKENLYVLDFDETILPFDSFRKFVYVWLRLKFLSIGWILLKRRLRIITAASFKAQVMDLAQQHPSFDEISKKFVDEIFVKVDLEILSRIHSKDSCARILLLSASPHFYINKLGERMGITAQGSYHEHDGKFIHLHGEGKINFILNNYPSSRYRYCYAISDSASDLPLLQMFEQYELLAPKSQKK